MRETKKIQCKIYRSARKERGKRMQQQFRFFVFQCNRNTFSWHYCVQKRKIQLPFSSSNFPSFSLKCCNKWLQTKKTTSTNHSNSKPMLDWQIRLNGKILEILSRQKLRAEKFRQLMDYIVLIAAHWITSTTYFVVSIYSFAHTASFWDKFRFDYQKSPPKCFMCPPMSWVFILTIVFINVLQ